MTKRAYLAGPEIFLADARDIGARKRPSVRHGRGQRRVHLIGSLQRLAVQ
jgi:hypothetical protein